MPEPQPPTWESLYAWANGKPEDATVGFSRDMFLGPLNLYFAETVRESQGKYWMIGHVNADVLVWDFPQKYMEMYRRAWKVPQWILDLMNRCDDLADEEHPSPLGKGYVVMGWLRPITAKMFKIALETVKPEQGGKSL